ncbi:phenylacetate--CoA ligase family protein [Candidatus Poribacteria bacterium]
MYEKLYAHCLFPMIQRLLGRNTLSVIKELEEAQWYPQEQMREIQLEKLKALVDHAAERVPYYRKLFRRLGIIPSDIQSFEDFAALPILDKEEIKADYHPFISESAKNYSIVRTGGSTGAPLQYPVDERTRSHHIADMIAARRWWGIDTDDKQMLFWGHGASLASGMRGQIQKVSQVLKDKTAHRMRCSAYKLSDEELYGYYERMVRFQPHFIYSYASAVYLFADFVHRRRLDMNLVPLKGVITTSEVLYEKERERIEASLTAPVINEYGMTEVGIIAYSCPEGNMHVMDPSVYVEKLPVKDSDSPHVSEIIVTPLSNLAAPLIRYRTGDLVQVSDDKGCPCGRNFSLLGKVMGRTHDLIQTMDGKRVYGGFFTYVLEHVPGIRQFQIVQDNLSHFNINVVREPDIYQDKSEPEIESRFKKMLGNSVSIDFNYVPTVEADPSGKHRYVISKIRQREVQ